MFNFHPLGTVDWKWTVCLQDITQNCQNENFSNFFGGFEIQDHCATPANKATNHMMKHNKGLNRIPDWLRSFSFFLYVFVCLLSSLSRFLGLCVPTLLPHGTFLSRIRLRCRVKKHQFLLLLLCSCVVASYRRDVNYTCTKSFLIRNGHKKSHFLWTHLILVK